MLGFTTNLTSSANSPMFWSTGGTFSSFPWHLGVVFFFFLIFIGVQLLYNVVSVSAVH